MGQALLWVLGNHGNNTEFLPLWIHTLDRETDID